MLARRSLRHPLLPHLRRATAREAAALARSRDRTMSPSWSNVRG